MPILNAIVIVSAIVLMTLGCVGIMKPGLIKQLTRERSVGLAITGVLLVIIAPYV